MWFKHEDPRISNDLVLKHGPGRFDFTEYNLRGIIAPSVWDIVVASAMAAQEQNDVPFSIQNIFFHPQHDYLFEVEKVIDSSQRMPPMNHIYIQGYSRILGRVTFSSSSLIHLGHLIDAHMPYNDKITVIESDNMSDVLAKVAIALANTGLIE